MNKTCFLIDTSGEVVNAIIVDDALGYTPDEGFTLMDAADAPAGVGIGWKVTGGVWTTPQQEG